MQSERYCVSGRVSRNGSLFSYFYNTLDEAIDAIKKEFARDDCFPYIVLTDEKNKIAQIIKGGNISPFISHLDNFYGRKWKLGVIIDINSIL